MKSDKALRWACLSIRSHCFVVAPTVFVVLVGMATAQVGSFTKAQVADRIRKVEDGVDEFRKYLETRGDNARDNAQSAQSSGATRRGRASSLTSESRQQRARQTKDDLDEALGDLNIDREMIMGADADQCLAHEIEGGGHAIC